ncbi:similar to An15g05480 [Aspergillus luchuensis]|uniref:Similar to An15g05480 n=1 Tax=Aspergillus kawachii TaxID=1069201 RepID=A0A146FZV0_ASPKA|nr:similar to An15g05480 [Aspergillus luchuensis]
MIKDLHLEGPRIQLKREMSHHNGFTMTAPGIDGKMQLHHFLPLAAMGVLALTTTAESTPLSARSELIKITTWSGNNCEGSSANPFITRGGESCFVSLPGASFNVSAADSKCKITTWSEDNCQGSSANFAGDVQGCIGIPFASVSLDC